MALNLDPQMLLITVLLITGVLVGITSGLLGVGGCFIMVPVQLWALTSMGLDNTLATRVAFGTGLAVVLPTAASGCRGHSCMGVVLWKPGFILGISGLVGAFLGGSIAAHLSGDLLRIAFGLSVIAGALRMIFAGKIKPGNPREGMLYYVIWGFPIGIVSGLSGIGGGMLMVPAMVIAMGFSMHQAVGTSSVAIALSSIGGIISYIINGLGVAGLLPYSLGYVNLLQFTLLAGMSVPTAQLGASISHRIPGNHLRQVFTLLMFYIGLRMIGIFKWLSLPI
jgi:uncharacterized protein